MLCCQYLRFSPADAWPLVGSLADAFAAVWFVGGCFAAIAAGRSYV
jgi:hypothetical protein